MNVPKAQARFSTEKMKLKNPELQKYWKKGLHELRGAIAEELKEFDKPPSKNAQPGKKRGGDPYALRKGLAHAMDTWLSLDAKKATSTMVALMSVNEKHGREWVADKLLASLQLDRKILSYNSYIYNEGKKMHAYDPRAIAVINAVKKLMKKAELEPPDKLPITPPNNNKNEAQKKIFMDEQVKLQKKAANERPLRATFFQLPNQLVKIAEDNISKKYEKEKERSEAEMSALLNRYLDHAMEKKDEKTRNKLAHLEDHLNAIWLEFLRAINAPKGSVHSSLMKKSRGLEGAIRALTWPLSSYAAQLDWDQKALNKAKANKAKANAANSKKNANAANKKKEESAMNKAMKEAEALRTGDLVKSIKEMTNRWRTLDNEWNEFQQHVWKKYNSVKKHMKNRYHHLPLPEEFPRFRNANPSNARGLHNQLKNAMRSMDGTHILKVPL